MTNNNHTNTNNNHTDQLDSRLDQVHRVFTEDHDALRQDLLDRLDTAPADLPVGAIPLDTSKNKRKWIMRSTIGLAAAITLAAVIGLSLFGNGPTAPTIAWADVRENVENATAKYYKEGLVVLDAEGKTVQRIESAEVWYANNGRTRFLRYDDEGKREMESVVTPEMNWGLRYEVQAVYMATDEPRNPHHHDKRLGVLEKLLLVTGKHAKRVGQGHIEGRLASRFEIAVTDMVRFELKQVGIEDPTPKQIEEMSGESPEKLRRSPAVQVWIDEDTGLPIRARIPMSQNLVERAGRGAGEVPEGGRVMHQIDFVGWNEQIDDAMFEPRIPEGWSLSHTHTVWFGDLDDILPGEMKNHQIAGVPLAEGVTFRLFDQEGELAATEADVLGVTRFYQNTGHSKGATEKEWDTRYIVFRFPGALQKQVDAAAPEVPAERVMWRYEIGGEITGEVRVWATGSGDDAGNGRGRLSHMTIGDLTAEQFRERYLAEE